MKQLETETIHGMNEVFFSFFCFKKNKKNSKKQKKQFLKELPSCRAHGVFFFELQVLLSCSSLFHVESTSSFFRLCVAAVKDFMER